MALPILLCNKKPPIDVDDDAMLRRIKIIPFRNIFTTYDDYSRPYDVNNPRHRLKDPNLREKLLMKCSQEQFLVWLVQGARKWYTDGLGVTPQCIVDAFNDYCAENDKLKSFIEEYCEVSPDYRVNAGDFRAAFNKHSGSNVQQIVLIERMKKRKFDHKQTREGKNSHVKPNTACI
ncbi:hypothetical protein BGX27_011482 [Mortierella sp. AM989]|nr:hypothetical protein BGX27_011482 [Mortierella sp. AM989]